jgi:hypothetical protein
MIAFLTLIYVGGLALLIKLKILPNSPGTWMTTIGWGRCHGNGRCTRITYLFYYVFSLMNYCSPPKYPPMFVGQVSIFRGI